LPIPPWLIVGGLETSTLSEELTLGGDFVDALSQEPSPEAVVIVQEGQQHFLDALTKLSPIHRDILVVREMEGLSYAEISQATGTAVHCNVTAFASAKGNTTHSCQANKKTFTGDAMERHTQKTNSYAISLRASQGSNRTSSLRVRAPEATLRGFGDLVADPSAPPATKGHQFSDGTFSARAH